MNTYHGLTVRERTVWRAQLALRPWRRHSLVLATLGAVFVLLGALWAYVVPVSPDRRAGLVVAFEIEQLLGLAPMQLWGPVWMAVGGMAFISTRWPPANEVWGYNAMAALVGTWGGLYLVGILFWGAPLSSATSVVVWWAFAFMLWGISGLRNPDDVVLIAPRAHDARHRGVTEDT